MQFQIVLRIEISRNSASAGSDKPRMLFFLLININMPTSVGILTFIGKKLSCSAIITLVSLLLLLLLLCCYCFIQMLLELSETALIVVSKYFT